MGDDAILRSRLTWFMVEGFGCVRAMGGSLIWGTTGPLALVPSSQPTQ